MDERYGKMKKLDNIGVNEKEKLEKKKELYKRVIEKNKKIEKVNVVGGRLISEEKI